MAPDLPRRSFLAAGTGLTLAGLGLAACSSTADSSGGGSSATVKTSDVPVGGGVILQSAQFVVTQPTAGQFKAFSSICTHQGCPVSQISNQQIICLCHGSRFSITDGSVISGPARRALAAAKVSESGGSLTIS